MYAFLYNYAPNNIYFYLHRSSSLWREAQKKRRKESERGALAALWGLTSRDWKRHMRCVIENGGHKRSELFSWRLVKYVARASFGVVWIFWWCICAQRICRTSGLCSSNKVSCYSFDGLNVCEPDFKIFWNCSKMVFLSRVTVLLILLSLYVILEQFKP